MFGFSLDNRETMSVLIWDSACDNNCHVGEYVGAFVENAWRLILCFGDWLNGFQCVFHTWSIMFWAASTFDEHHVEICYTISTRSFLRFSQYLIADHAILNEFLGVIEDRSVNFLSSSRKLTCSTAFASSPRMSVWWCAFENVAIHFLYRLCKFLILCKNAFGGTQSSWPLGAETNCVVFPLFLD